MIFIEQKAGKARGVPSGSWLLHTGGHRQTYPILQVLRLFQPQPYRPDQIV